jgi:hypothetical protein
MDLDLPQGPGSFILAWSSGVTHGFGSVVGVSMRDTIEL